MKVEIKLIKTIQTQGNLGKTFRHSKKKLRDKSHQKSKMMENRISGIEDITECIHLSYRKC